MRAANADANGACSHQSVSAILPSASLSAGKSASWKLCAGVLTLSLGVEGFFLGVACANEVSSLFTALH